MHVFICLHELNFECSICKLVQRLSDIFYCSIKQKINSYIIIENKIKILRLYIVSAR
jgi:hypothetical protein